MLRHHISLLYIFFPSVFSSLASASSDRPWNSRLHHSHRLRQNVDRVFTLEDSHKGPTFFDEWDFYNSADPTHGMVNYVDANEAFASHLAYVREDNVTIIAVDNETKLNPGEYRKSVRISSKKQYNSGLFIFDVEKAPYGCAVWPAAWLVGPNWPSGGEIDIIEGVHNQVYNQYTLHTGSGCQVDSSKNVVGDLLASDLNANVFTGTILATNCDANQNYNSGCGISDTDPQSYGSGLEAAGGGVFATLWDNEGVRIWFFTRASIPNDITDMDPKPTQWGAPKAFWASSTCSSSFFSDQSIVFDIALAGDWGAPTFNADGCPGEIADWIANPSNFNHAQWFINSVLVYKLE